MPSMISWEEAVRRLIADPAQAELVRDCYFDPPLEGAVERYRAGREWQAVRAVVGAGAGRRALDVGAGNGIVSYALARDGWRVSALEPDPSDLVGRGAVARLAGGCGLDIVPLDGVGERIPLDDATLDLVIARQVLHHAADLDAFCREAARVLRPGGRLLAFRDHVADDADQKAAFLAGHPLHRLYGGENAFPEARYAGAIAGAGLTILRRWRHFEAAFNFAPKTARDVAGEAARRLLPAGPAAIAAGLLGSPVLFPLLARALTAVDRRPGRLVAFLAERPTR